MSAKNRDSHNRWRSITVGFRVSPEENEQIADAFLAEHPDFTRESFTLPEPVGRTDGQLTLWPQRHNTDGFYICRMKRNG